MLESHPWFATFSDRPLEIFKNFHAIGEMTQILYLLRFSEPSLRVSVMFFMA